MVFFLKRGELFTPKLASEYAVGESVFLDVGGVSTEFLVVHQGNPDNSLYDSSCNDTWLLMKDCYSTLKFHGIRNDYVDSIVHDYLNNDFLGLLDGNVQNNIKQVTIPYYKSGLKTLNTKVFLLGATEIGLMDNITDSIPLDGAKLDYFESGTSDSAEEKRIAYLNGEAVYWWTRTPHKTSSGSAWQTNAYGSQFVQNVTVESGGVRPALILSSDTKFNAKTNLIL